MHKRQDVAISHPLPCIFHFTMLLILVGLSACQPLQTATPTPTLPTANTPTPAPPETTPTPASSVTPERTETFIPSATPTADCLLVGGTQQSAIIDSEHLGADFHYQIYLPPCYDANPEERYPVLYLLHGLSYNSEQWLRLGLVNSMDNLIAEGTLPPFIIVLPQESPFIPPQASRFPDALIKDLIPWIDENYHTLPEKDYLPGIQRKSHLCQEGSGHFEQ